MKPIYYTITTLLLCLTSFLGAQNNISFEYSYDNCGNRISRNVITLKKHSPADSIDNNIAEDISSIENYSNVDNETISFFDKEIIIEVYPNPFKDYINLDISNNDIENISFCLIAMDGKVIQDKQATANNNIIDFSSLPPGSYIFSIFSYNQLIKEIKIIKQ